MELPKHTTQVGTIAANKKMYLEDYCISYMKQLTEEFPEDRKQIALYGTVEKEKSVEYTFVYGAALLGKGRGRTDSLTNSQKDEAESIRKEFFSDYQLVGIVISTDAVNENIFWLGNGNKSIPMDGYYIFYDTNEAMLNFMMENQKEFKPYIPAEKITPEITITSIVMGIILAVVFGAANAYLGLRVGMTVSASIPAADP